MTRIDAHPIRKRASDHQPPQAGGSISVKLAEFVPSSFTTAQPANPSDEGGSLILAVPPPEASTPSTPTSGRWHASAWLFWREGGNIPNALSPGRLGGSQAGIRIDFLLAKRITAYGRITGAFEPPVAPEAALGFSLRPMPDIPVSIGLERRIALGDGGRNANAALIAGGFGPAVLTGELEAEGYTQMGMVGLRRRDLFADGKFSVLSPIRKSPIRIGGSLSGGAQPHLERLDIGPELQWRLALPNGNARLTVEWRERIAGRAHPPSGLAMTLATDF
ncbi:MAG: hypothetical protein QM605_15665 [Sphingobium sp.]